MGILLHFGYFFALFALQTERKPLLFLIFVLFLRFLRKLLCQSTHKHQKYPLIEKKKKRPGVYQRYENVGGVSIAGATDGIVACCICSN